LKIVFNLKDIKFRFNKSALARKVIKDIFRNEKKQLGEISIIFTGNTTILSLNQLYLKHSYYTDVIAFGNNVKGICFGDIFISVEQVARNAEKYHTPFSEELFRVIIHGVLHLIGYNDKTEKEKKLMLSLEEKYLYSIRD
jgi:rRNA maturation RNase YbeY